MENLRERLKSNQAIGVILSLVVIAHLIHLFLSPWVYRKVFDGFYLGFFPIACGALLLLLSLILTFDSHRKEKPANLMTLTIKSFLTVILILGGCWVYFMVMREIGFLIITPIFLLLFMYTLGLKSWRKCIAGAVVTTAIVYVIFSLLGLKLPAGILSDILPL